jgi:hypothetical protein
MAATKTGKSYSATETEVQQMKMSKACDGHALMLGLQA